MSSVQTLNMSTTQVSHNPDRPVQIEDVEEASLSAIPLVPIPTSAPASPTLRRTSTREEVRGASISGEPAHSALHVLSAPPRSIDGGAEASHKPRRPSRVPDVDRSPPITLSVSAPVDVSPPEYHKQKSTDMAVRPDAVHIPVQRETVQHMPLSHPRDTGFAAESTPGSRGSSSTVLSAISVEASSAPTSECTSSAFRYTGAHTVIPASEASEQQQEMDRVFEGRRYVDNYTVTHADVLKLRAEFQQRFPSSSGLPTVAHPYSVLRSPGPYPPDVDIRIREMYLSDAEFQALFHTTKAAWLNLPEWRQRSMKKNLGLF